VLGLPARIPAASASREFRLPERAKSASTAPASSARCTSAVFAAFSDAADRFISPEFRSINGAASVSNRDPTPLA